MARRHLRRRGHTGRTLLMGRPRCLIGGRDEQAGGVAGWVGGWAHAVPGVFRCPPARWVRQEGTLPPALARSRRGFSKRISYHIIVSPGLFSASIRHHRERARDAGRRGRGLAMPDGRARAPDGALQCGQREVALARGTKESFGISRRRRVRWSGE